jgi:hypothetical protein
MSYRFYDLDNAIFRAPISDGAMRYPVEDVLVGKSWQPYAPSRDHYAPVAYGDEIDDPLGGPTRDDFDPNQKRDPDGQWTSGGGGSKAKAAPPSKEAAFKTLAEGQRGDPEMAMVMAQKKLGGGVMSYAIEHAGDLTHRMAEYGGQFGSQYVAPKVNNLLRDLTHGYGFEREHRENMRASGTSPEDEAAVLERYAAAHEKLPVYNRAQELGRDIPIKIARKQFAAAIEDLTELQGMIKSKKYDKVSQEYDPEYGKAVGAAFVSPSVADHLDFPEAVAGLKSKRQKMLALASHEIDRGLGLRTEDSPAVGAWSDGAENSVMTTIHGGTFEQLRIAAAMKASIAEQKAALIFQHHDDGNAALYTFTAKGDLDTIHKHLLADGVEFHTIIPTSGGATVHVVDMSGDAYDAVSKAAARHHAEVGTELGRAEFIGTTKQDGTDREQRDHAIAEYERIIGGSGDKDTAKLWKRIHSAYGKKLHLEQDHWHSDIDYPWTQDVDWDPADHPRGQPDNEGQFVKGAGSHSAPAPEAPKATATAAETPGLASRVGSAIRRVLPSRGSTTAREVKAEAAKAARATAKAAQTEAVRARNAARLAAMPAKEPFAISTRIPSEANRREGDDAHQHPHSLVDWDTATKPEARDWLKKATDLLTGRTPYPPGKDDDGNPLPATPYVGMPPGPEGETPIEAAERSIAFMQGNIMAIYNAVPRTWRTRASHWYDGANRIANNWANEYGYSAPQMAGALAALSPKKDWFQNVDIAKRILDYTRDHQDTPFTDEAAAAFTKLANQQKKPAVKRSYQVMLASFKKPDGSWKKLKELTDPTERAAWINMHDVAHGDTKYHPVTPEGDFQEGWVTNKAKPATKTKPGQPGKPTTRVWATIDNVAKVMNILDNGSAQNISENTGEAHKVRNFYMNILHPNSQNGHVTIDTHAIAAAFLRPLGQNDSEVLVGLGNSSPSYAPLGLGGTYPLIAEAYRRAAREAGVLPRQMQSITWEGLRNLFTPEDKRSDAIRDKATAIWRRVHEGTISPANARKRVLLMASPALRGAPRTPGWVTS